MTDERRERYAAAILNIPRLRDGKNLQRQAEAAMALADEEHADLEAENARLREERDLAVAHDRQPYPTQAAYDAACTALHQHRQRAEQLEAEVERLRALTEHAKAAPWVSPDRHSGTACIGGTRIPAHIIAGLVPDVGLAGVADLYPDVGPEAAAAAVWFGQRYIDRADHDGTEVAAALARTRQITEEDPQ